MKIKSKIMGKAIKRLNPHLYLNFLAKPDFIAYRYKDMPNKKIEKLRKKGMPIYLWVTDKDEEIKYDGIIFEKRDD